MPRRFTGTPEEVAAENLRRSPNAAVAESLLCGARLKDGHGGFTGETCKQTRGERTAHRGFGRCWKHGGRSKNGIKFAADQMAQEAVERERSEMRLFGRRSVITPEDALLEEMQRTHGIVRSIEDQMAEWRAEAYRDVELSNVTDGDTELDEDAEQDSGARYGETVTGLPQLVAVHSTEKALGFTDTEWAAWIKVYEVERKHLVAVAQACISLGLQEKRQRMLEANADFMRRVVLAAMTTMGVKATAEEMAPVMQAAIRTVVQEIGNTVR